MLIHFSTNPLEAIKGIVCYNYKAILGFVVISTAVCLIYTFVSPEFTLPVVPVSILGGGLAIFLAFRINYAYDRWWEARKIWGGVVNISRTLAMEVCTLIRGHEHDELKRGMVYRHLAWINALRLQLRKQSDWEQIEDFLSKEEFDRVIQYKNTATQLIHRQGHEIARAKDIGLLSEFEQKKIYERLKEMYDLQGKAERIKNTVFPYYYLYFTEMFLWVFVAMLPCALVDSIGWLTIPVSVVISFVFYILDKSGIVTEDPFEARAADTPLSSLCRIIEIDLRQQLGES